MPDTPEELQIQLWPSERILSRICQRFELFINGLEIGNAYSELLDPHEHISRFENAAAARTKMGKTPYPPDAGFLEAL